MCSNTHGLLGTGVCRKVAALSATLNARGLHSTLDQYQNLASVTALADPPP